MNSFPMKLQKKRVKYYTDILHDFILINYCALPTGFHYQTKIVKIKFIFVNAITSYPFHKKEQTDSSLPLVVQNDNAGVWNDTIWSEKNYLCARVGFVVNLL
jgi:hypothetical protein